jgi:hypothetical protein
MERSLEMDCLHRGFVLGATLLFWLLPISLGQNPQPQAGVKPGHFQDSVAATEKANNKKSKHADDFLVRGTIFTPEGLSFPGAEIRIRRSNEKKFRWDTWTNSRGEFAVRVKQGSDYEVVARAKGFKEQSKAVDAKSGGRVEEITFRMEREGDQKP